MKKITKQEFYEELGNIKLGIMKIDKLDEVVQFKDAIKTRYGAKLSILKNGCFISFDSRHGKGCSYAKTESGNLLKYVHGCLIAEYEEKK